jgi:uncharacterized protein (UPF0332 family)
MIDIIDWNECKRNFVRQIEVDKEEINSILKMVELRLKHVKSSNVNNENVSFVIEGYYEIIKELLVALLLSNGLRSKNHQCLISYLYNKYKEYEAEAYLISRMSYLRNRLDYYGEQIDFGFYEKNKDEFLRIIKLLQKLLS